MTKEKTCSCGHDRKNPLVTNKNSYSLWGWVWLCFGVTAKPKQVRFVCSVCGEEIGSTTDPKEMEKYRFE